jgi:hypothetical protein
MINLKILHINNSVNNNYIFIMIIIVHIYNYTNVCRLNLDNNIYKLYLVYLKVWVIIFKRNIYNLNKIK